MDFNQIKYFLHLADALNFTEAASRSGVSQPSLTKAIRKLEAELGRSLLHRDGKNTRLTALGREIQVEFMRLEKGRQQVHELAENAVSGRRRVLNLAGASTIAPNAISGFLTHALNELPTIEINIHAQLPQEGANAVLAGKHDGCFLPTAPKQDEKLAVLPLYAERLMLTCAQTHPLAAQSTVTPEQMATQPYMDRLNCEFRSQIIAYFMDREILMRPRFSSEREDWVQQMVLSGDAICIMPERSALLPGLTTRPVEQLDLDREIVFVVVSGAGNPVELRQLFALARKYDWGEQALKL